MWQLKKPTKNLRCMRRLPWHRGSTQSDLFGSHGDLRNGFSRRRDVVAEIAGTDANTDTCQFLGRARLRVFGVLDQDDFLKLHRGLRITSELPSHDCRRGENRKSYYNISFHTYLSLWKLDLVAVDLGQDVLGSRQTVLDNGLQVSEESFDLRIRGRLNAFVRQIHDALLGVGYQGHIHFVKGITIERAQHFRFSFESGEQALTLFGLRIHNELDSLFFGDEHELCVELSITARHCAGVCFHEIRLGVRVRQITDLDGGLTGRVQYRQSPLEIGVCGSTNLGRVADQGRCGESRKSYCNISFHT